MPNKTGTISELAGAGKTMAGVSILYLLGGLALSGIPPLNGFISKLTVVQGGIEGQQWLVLGLAVGAGLITLLYMARTWQHIFQRAPDAALALKPYGDSLIAPALLIGLCIVLGVYALPLMEAATLAVERMGDPNIYIRGVLGGLR
jgi:multicomponent Na+:H+ antiporter subunit D